MKRREFLALSSGVIAAMALDSPVFAMAPVRIDSGWYRRSRRFANTSISRVAYVERGRGPVALFLHGYPLNGYQWRGALERLHPYRRCLVPDMMGLGHTTAPAVQEISARTQATMLASLLDTLKIETVDLVANDSGGMVAQLFVAKYPTRVRTLLLTNCDVDENSPPPQILPFIEQAEKGVFVDEVIVPQLKDKQLARAATGLGGMTYTYPDRLADETIEAYFRPIVETPFKKAQANQFFASMRTNPLVAIRDDLKKWRGPARMVWGLKDPLFGMKWADWLDQNLSGSRGIRQVEAANLFFPEEMPDLIAEEARQLWLPPATERGDLL